MNVKNLLNNRDSIGRAEMLSHRGQWVALSADGSKIVATAPTLEMLEATLVEKRVDPQSVLFEFLPGAEEQKTLCTPEFRHEIPVPE